MGSKSDVFYCGRISEPIAEGTFCKVDDTIVAFTAPIDLLPGDGVIIDQRDGRPLAVFRAGFPAYIVGEIVQTWGGIKPAEAT